MDDMMDIDPRANYPLDLLPAEIVQEVAWHLAYPSGEHWENEEPHVQDFANLRSTCKALEGKTHHAFVRVFFNSRTVDFSEEGMNSLRAVANVPEFADTVTTLKFVRNCEPQGRDTQLLDIWHNDPDQQKRVDARILAAKVKADWKNRAVSATTGFKCSPYLTPSCSTLS
jgi:hypothetical protein